MKGYLKILSIFFAGAMLGGLVVYGVFVPKQNGQESGKEATERLREASVAGVGQAVYRNDKRSFSLGYPKELSVQEIDEGYGSETVLFTKPGQQTGFQLFITPYNDTVITEERIRTDVQGPTTDFLEVVIGENIRAARFKSTTPSIGEATEVWFIRSGYLYEFTTYAAEDEVLAKVLSTLRFDE